MEELKKKTETMLRAVLISSPRGVPLYKLDREYKSITYEPIPYRKCGYNSLEAFLRNIPHVASIQTDRDGETLVKGVSSAADQHVAKLIAKQKKPKLKKSTRKPARRPMSFTTGYAAPQYSTSKFGPRAQSNVIVQTQSQSASLFNYSLPSISPAFTSNPSHRNVAFGSIRGQTTPRFVPPRMLKLALVASNRTKAGGANDFRLSISTNTGSNQRKVTAFLAAKESPPPVTPPAVKGDSQEHRTILKAQRTIKSKGGPNFQDMEITLPSKSPVGEKIASTIKSSRTAEIAPEVLKRIIQILMDKPNGVFGTRLPTEYKNKFQEDLPDKTMDQLISLPHIVRHEEPIKGQVIFYPPKQQTPDSSQEQEKSTQKTETSSQTEELFALRSMSLPAADSAVEVYVTHVESIANFYVQFTSHEEKIYDLQALLKKDFENSTNAIPKPVPGMFCAAKFTEDDDWYRGMILECVNERETLTVNVKYVDYGNSEFIPASRLQHLKERHAELPMMAVCCSLEGVDPLVEGKAAENKCTQRFKDLIGDAELKMVLVNRNGGVLSVYLTNKEEADIGTTLVKEGLAVKDNEEILSTLSSSTSSISSTSAVASTPSVDGNEASKEGANRTTLVKEGVTVKENDDISSTLSSSTSSIASTSVVASAPSEVEEKPAAKPFLRSRSIQKEQEVVKTPERVVIPDDDYLDVCVSTILNTENISVTLYGEEYSDKLLGLEKSMMCYFSDLSDDQAIQPKVGDLCAISSTELHSENQWYRVRVLNITGSQTQLEFVDYGDVKHAPLSELKALPARFYELPLQAFTVSLIGIPKTKNPEVIDKLKHITLGKPLVAQICYRAKDVLSVELFDTSSDADVNINNMLQSLIMPDEELKPALPKAGYQASVVLVYVSETGSVFVQIPGAGLTRLEELMTDITDHYSKSTKAAEFVAKPHVGKICCAKCSDSSWYRAIIMQILPDRKVEVQCVDYGHLEVLPAAALREPTKANEHVSSLPFQAVECKLFGVSEESWNAEQREKITQLALDGVILEVVKRDTPAVVNLFLTTEDDDVVNILDYVLEEKQQDQSAVNEEAPLNCSAGEPEQAEKESSSQEDELDESTSDLPPPLKLSRSWVDVVVSEIIDPGNFMFQPLEMLEAFEDVMDQMAQHYGSAKKEPLASPRTGDLCAAHHDDGNYYRAAVKAVLAPQQICVMFMDYGDFGIMQSSNLLVLHDKFKQLPFLAVHGSLAGLQGSGEACAWSDQAKQRFEKMVHWKMLVASVEGDQYTYSFREEHRVPLILYDTSGNGKDLNIGNVLVRDGFAKRLDS